MKNWQKEIWVLHCHLRIVSNYSAATVSETQAVSVGVVKANWQLTNMTARLTNFAVEGNSNCASAPTVWYTTTALKLVKKAAVLGAQGTTLARYASPKILHLYIQGISAILPSPWRFQLSCGFAPFAWSARFANHLTSRPDYSAYQHNSYATKLSRMCHLQAQWSRPYIDVERAASGMSISPKWFFEHLKHLHPPPSHASTNSSDLLKGLSMASLPKDYLRSQLKVVWDCSVLGVLTFPISRRHYWILVLLAQLVQHASTPPVTWVLIKSQKLQYQGITALKIQGIRNCRKAAVCTVTELIHSTAADFISAPKGSGSQRSVQLIYSGIRKDPPATGRKMSNCVHNVTVSPTNCWLFHRTQIKQLPFGKLTSFVLYAT